MSAQNIVVGFQRFRFSQSGRIAEREEASVTVECQPEQEILSRAFASLFAQRPEWAKGEPVKDGRGWSSASIMPSNQP